MVTHPGSHPSACSASAWAAPGKAAEGQAPREGPGWLGRIQAGCTSGASRQQALPPGERVCLPTPHVSLSMRAALVLGLFPAEPQARLPGSNGEPCSSHLFPRGTDRGWSAIPALCPSSAPGKPATSTHSSTGTMWGTGWHPSE